LISRRLRKFSYQYKELTKNLELSGLMLVLDLNSNDIVTIMCHIIIPKENETSFGVKALWLAQNNGYV
jgi:hypothetical protein